MSDKTDSSTGAHAGPDHSVQDQRQPRPARSILDYARDVCQSDAAQRLGFVSWEIANRAGRAQIGQLQKLQDENRLLRHRLETLVDLLVTRGVLDEAGRIQICPEPELEITLNPPPTEEQLLQYLEQIQDNPRPPDPAPTPPQQP